MQERVEDRHLVVQTVKKPCEEAAFPVLRQACQEETVADEIGEDLSLHCCTADKERSTSAAGAAGGSVSHPKLLRTGRDDRGR